MSHTNIPDYLCLQFFFFFFFPPFPILNSASEFIYLFNFLVCFCIFFSFECWFLAIKCGSKGTLTFCRVEMGFFLNELG